MASVRNLALAGHACPEQRLGDAMHNQVGVAADRRGEVRVAGRGQRKMALVDLGVASLLERTQHQVAQNPLLWLALDLRRQLLVHAWRDRNVFGYLVHPRIAPAALRIATIPAGLDALDRQSAQAQRVAEGCGQLLELDN